MHIKDEEDSTVYGWALQLCTDSANNKVSPLASSTSLWINVIIVYLAHVATYLNWLSVGLSLYTKDVQHHTSLIWKLTSMQEPCGLVFQVRPLWKTFHFIGWTGSGCVQRQATDPVNIQRPYRQQNTRSKYGTNHPETVNGVNRSLKVEYANQGGVSCWEPQKHQVCAWDLCVWVSLCVLWMRAFLWGTPGVSG